MTWELADSGNEFITSVINGADLVPTFSAASVDDLRAEVNLDILNAKNSRFDLLPTHINRLGMLFWGHECMIPIHRGNFFNYLLLKGPI